MNNRIIKTNIQCAREKIGLSQEEMADKLGILRIESGKWTEHERDVYKAKSEEDEKLIESLNAHIKTLQMIVNSRTHEEE